MRTFRGYVTRAQRSVSPSWESSRIARRYARVLLAVLAVMGSGCFSSNRRLLDLACAARTERVAEDEQRLAAEVTSLRIQVSRLSTECEELRTEILLLKRRVKMAEP